MQTGIGGQRGLGNDAGHTQPADVLDPNWVLEKPALLIYNYNITLTESTLNKACVTVG